MNTHAVAPMRLHVDSRFLSPYALSAFVGLRAKGLRPELVRVDLDAGQQHGCDFALASITQRVPMLAHDGFHLGESSAIVEYLDDTLPGPALLPRDARQRARARQVQAWLRSDLGALRDQRNTEAVFLEPPLTPLDASGEAALRKLIAVAEVLVDPARETLFDAWSIADVDLALMLMRLRHEPQALPQPLRDYARRQWEHPAIREWLTLAADANRSRAGPRP